MLAGVFLFLSCVTAERDNPNDPGSKDYQGYQVIDPPSSSKPSSSSFAAKSSSSGAVSSSSVNILGGCPNAEMGNNTISCGGQSYKTVKIGEQVWMAENLNYNAPNSKCYGDYTGGDRQGNCAIYGRLYNWATAMANSAGSNANPSGVRGVCPSGWHIPSDAEWNTLMKFVNPSCTDNSSCAGAGKKLKANSPLWENSGKGTDDFDFSALPGGHTNTAGNSNTVGYGGSWWSASEYDSGETSYRYISGNRESVDWYNVGKGIFFSVRCVQD